MLRHLAALVFSLGLLAAPLTAQANDPDPVSASLMSAAATVIPSALGLGLLTTGRGWREGFRYESGIGALGFGAIVGPSMGQIYARGGLSAVLTFTLRAMTGSVMLYGLHKQLRGGEEADSIGTALTVVGGIPTALLAIYDIVNASTQAEATQYEAGYALLEPEQELISISRCGAIPCGTGEHAPVVLAGRN